MGENNGDSFRKDILIELYRRIVLQGQSLKESYRHVEKLYFWTIIATISIFFFLLQRGEAVSSLCVVFAVLYCWGLVTFIRMVSLDVQRIDLSRSLKKIQDELINLCPQIAKALEDLVIAVEEDFNKWSSFRGIFERALMLCGVKTTVTFLNSCFLTASLVIPICPVNPWFASSVGVVAFFLSAFLHVHYASWRYRRALKGPVKASRWA